MGAIWYSYSVHLMNLPMTSLGKTQEKKKSRVLKATNSVFMELGKTKIPRSLN